MQVWSRFEGYPGDGVYLEFHKMRWPGGLKLWRVSGPSVDLGAKEPYDPGQARDRARGHADHFAGLLAGIAAAEAGRRDGVIVAPFDTELFGHWWFEGPDFLGDVYRALRGRPDVRPTTGSGHLAPPSITGGPPDAIRLVGRQRRLLDVAQRADGLDLGAPLAAGGAVLGCCPGGARVGAARFILAQAARELLLAQSSDWQFIISTGAAADYGERRFREHCSETEELVDALVDGSPEALERGSRRAAELGERDAIFPDVLPAIAAALAGSRSLAIG